jgi:hypothetical protein
MECHKAGYGPAAGLPVEHLVVTHNDQEPLLPAHRHTKAILKHKVTELPTQITLGHGWQAITTRHGEDDDIELLALKGVNSADTKTLLQSRIATTCLPHFGCYTPTAVHGRFREPLFLHCLENLINLSRVEADDTER